VPIAEKELKVPYAYMNGHCNLILPHKFDKLEPALQLASQGMLLAKHPAQDGTRRKLVVIPVVEKKGDLGARITRVFAESETRVISENEIDVFLDEIDREAHV